MAGDPEGAGQGIGKQAERSCPFRSQNVINLSFDRRRAGPRYPVALEPF